MGHQIEHSLVHVFGEAPPMCRGQLEQRSGRRLRAGGSRAWQWFGGLVRIASFWNP